MGQLELGFESFIFFILIFARLMGVFVQAPLFGRPKGIPMPVQIGYSLAFSLIFFSVLPIPAYLPKTLVALCFEALVQVLIGLMIGFASFIVAAAVQFAGEVSDISMSLNIAASYDQMSGQSVNLVRQFEFRLAILVWIFIHGDYFLFKAILRSYELIPPTQLIAPGSVYNLIHMTSGIFVTGMELAAPVVIAVFMVSTAMCLLNRASQQFNVFVMSFPLYIISSIGALALSIPLLFWKVLPAMYSNLNHDIIQLILAMKGG